MNTPDKTLTTLTHTITCPGCGALVIQYLATADNGSFNAVHGHLCQSLTPQKKEQP